MFLQVLAFFESAKMSYVLYLFCGCWRHVIELVSRFGADWILKGSQNHFFSKSIFKIKLGKLGSKTGGVKGHDLLIDLLMPEVVRKNDRKWRSKWRQKVTKV